MIYQPKTIKEVVNEINTKYFLPHIQRELVWLPPQISKLFDSLMRGYPIGTFLFWRIAKKKDITKLEFIKNYKKGKKNEINNSTNKDEYWLVLDGQQRLQSFYIAINGSYGDKELFLNVLSEKLEHEDTDDEENEIIYETKFFKNASDYFIKENPEQKSKSKKLWVKIKNFALLNEDRRDDFIEKLKNDLADDLLHSDARLLERNIKKIHTLVSSIETIFYYLENEENYDKVLDIFIRTNSGGTKLSKSDLLFSMVKLQWKNRDAYREFNQLEEEINIKGEFEFDKDFILKTSLVLIGADPKYRIENFNRKNISIIESQWDRIASSIRVAIDLLTNIGIASKKVLTSKNSLIPIIYFTYLNKLRTYSGDKSSIIKARNAAKNWLLNVLLVNLYSSQTDEMLKRARTAIDKNKGKIFPAESIMANLPPGKSAEFKQETFNEIGYDDGRALLVLALLYPDFNLNAVSATNRPNIDHIFPQDLSDKGFDSEILDNIGNLELLTDTENKQKQDVPFKKWLKSRDISFIKRNYIPSSKDLYAEDKYKDFIQQRREIMFRALLRKL